MEWLISALLAFFSYAGIVIAIKKHRELTLFKEALHSLNENHLKAVDPVIEQKLSPRMIELLSSIALTHKEQEEELYAHIHELRDTLSTLGTKLTPVISYLNEISSASHKTHHFVSSLYDDLSMSQKIQESTKKEQHG